MRRLPHVLLLAGTLCIGSFGSAAARDEGIAYIHPRDFPSEKNEWMSRLTEAITSEEVLDYAALVALAAAIAPICPACAVEILTDIIAVHAPVSFIQTVKEGMQTISPSQGWSGGPSPSPSGPPAPSSMPGIAPGTAPLLGFPR